MLHHPRVNFQAPLPFLFLFLLLILLLLSRRLTPSMPLRDILVMEIAQMFCQVVFPQKPIFRLAIAFLERAIHALLFVLVVDTAFVALQVRFAVEGFVAGFGGGGDADAGADVGSCFGGGGFRVKGWCGGVW
jgi:hypothetical protein